MTMVQDLFCIELIPDDNIVEANTGEQGRNKPNKYIA